MNKHYVRLALAGLMLVLSPTLGVSATITFKEAPPVCAQIRIIGPISRQDVVVFRNTLNQLRSAQRASHLPGCVGLYSPGGDVDAAMEIGRMIRAAQLQTNVIYVSGTRALCASSCVLVFVGGVRRMPALADPSDTRLGIHRPFDTEVGAKPQDRADTQFKVMAAKLRAYLAEMNIPERLADEMIRTPPESVRFLTREEAEQYGLLGDDPAYADMEVSAKANKLGISKVEYYERQTRYESECRPLLINCSQALLLSQSQEPCNRYYQCKQRIFPEK